MNQHFKILLFDEVKKLLAEKTGWGRNEVLLKFEHAYNQAVQEYQVDEPDISDHERSDDIVHVREGRKKMNKCECSTWARTNILLLTEHHKNCPKYDPEGDSRAIIKSLCIGIEAWSNDEDGVHPDCWKAYQDAKIFIGHWPRQ
jgi:hypothetical protein